MSQLRQIYSNRHPRWLEDDIILWRYMPLERLFCYLDGNIFLPSFAKLCAEDPFEGEGCADDAIRFRNRFRRRDAKKADQVEKWICDQVCSTTDRDKMGDKDAIERNRWESNAAEARNVAKLLGGDCVLRVGPDAREAELKAAVSPRVLHLATHGFYLPAQEFRRTNSLPFGWPGDRGQAGRLPYVQSDWENPLVRCGIALAGANHAGQITNAVAEDGLLTGLEASLLNLQGTELVILSACDSGTGEVRIGEGVMSLRRAFRIAGAQTVLASHWPVNDKATSQLMREFIRRWRSGEPRAKAWREAQLSLLHSNEFQNPYLWAAFTLTGQWR